MRRTLLSVAVAVASFAGAASILFYGFEAIAGRSTPPSQEASASSAEPAASDDPAPSAPTSSNLPDPSPSAPAPASGAPSASSAPEPPPSAPASGEPATPDGPRTGLLSGDFYRLGIDDPTTTIDESLRSACGTVDALVGGPALCRER